MSENEMLDFMEALNDLIDRRFALKIREDLQNQNPDDIISTTQEEARVKEAEKRLRVILRKVVTKE